MHIIHRIVLICNAHKSHLNIMCNSKRCMILSFIVCSCPSRSYAYVIHGRVGSTTPIKENRFIRYCWCDMHFFLDFKSFIHRVRHLESFMIISIMIIRSFYIIHSAVLSDYCERTICRFFNVILPPLALFGVFFAVCLFYVSSLFKLHMFLCMCVPRIYLLTTYKLRASVRGVWHSHCCICT